MATYLVTGSNRGIGLELCRQLKQRGQNVIATCRSSSEELNSLGVQVETNVDLVSEDSMIKLKAKLSGINIDVLINNAGILEVNSLSCFSKESLSRQFEVNTIGPLIFTQHFLGNLRNGSKIVFITSRMGSISDNSSGGYYGYRMSKAALCMAGKSLSVDLRSKGITVALLHPGLVSTRMTGFTNNGISTNQSVRGLIKRIDDLALEGTGCFFHSNGEELPW